MAVLSDFSPVMTTGTPPSSWRTGARLARRELRSGLKGLWIFFTCLLLGVTAIAVVGSLSASVERGLAGQARPLLGGDVEFAVLHRQLNGAELAYLASLGTVSKVADMRGIARHGQARAMVEVKAVDDLYPVFGQVELKGGKSFAGMLTKTGPVWSALAEPGLLDRLGIRPGEIIELGLARFVVRAVIEREPDRITGGFILAPRLMISREALVATGLITPGSLITWRYRVRLEGAGARQPPAAIVGQARARFPDAGWRITTRDRAAPGVERFLQRLTLFLTLAGLTALIVGGVGVANAVTTFLDQRRDSIATLKCLGASTSDIFAIYLFEILGIATLAIISGVALGALAPLALHYVLGALLPVPLATGVAARPLLLAAAFGYLVAIAFAVWPLAKACKTPASSLFRGAAQGAREVPPFRFVLVVILALVVLVLLALVSFPQRPVTLAYLAGLALAIGLLLALARLAMFAVRRFVHPENAVMRYAIGNLYRPGARTASIVVSLGLGLTVFVMLALIDRSITSELRGSVPARAPTYFFLDVTAADLDAFTSFLRGYEGVEAVSSAPMLRGRILKINGKPVEKRPMEEHVKWAFRGDRGLTYASLPPPASRLSEGAWWPAGYDGPPLVSFVDEIARGAGLKIGDKVTINILGRQVTARIHNLRAVDWQSLQINFAMVFSPNTFAGAPHTNIVTVTMPGGKTGPLLRDATARYPTITAIRVKDALLAVSQMVGNLLNAVRAASAVTLLTGIVVLAGALAGGLSARIYDSVVLKTFGATRRQLLRAFVIEYAFIGLLTAAFAIGIGTAAAWGIIHFVMNMTWQFSAGAALLTALGAMVLTITAGLMTTHRSLGARPARILRSE